MKASPAAEFASHRQNIAQHGLQDPFCIDPSFKPEHLSAAIPLVCHRELPIDTTFAVHACSLLELKQLLTTGALPASKWHDETKGCFAFEPLLERVLATSAIKDLMGARGFNEMIGDLFSDQILPRGSKVPEPEVLAGQPIEHEFKDFMLTSAAFLARRQMCLELFDLKSTSASQLLLAEILADVKPIPEEASRSFKALEEQGHSPEKIKAVLEYLGNFQGFLIGLSSDFYGGYKFAAIPSHENVPYVKAPEGVGLNFITGIKPLGEAEATYLRMLRTA